MSQMSVPDAYVADWLDVDAEAEALGISTGDLDRQLVEAELEDSELLKSLLRPEPGLEDRIEERVRDRLRAREEAWLVIDLINLGWQTMKAVLDLDTEGGFDDQ